MVLGWSIFSTNVDKVSIKFIFLVNSAMKLNIAKRLS